MADIIDLNLRRMAELDKENAKLHTEWRELFVLTVANVPEDIFEKIYFAAKPVLAEWIEKQRQSKL